MQIPCNTDVKSLADVIVSYRVGLLVYGCALFPIKISNLISFVASHTVHIFIGGNSLE
jgi:hypothetical protein